MKMNIGRITLFETPGVVLRRKSDQVLLGEVLSMYPKHPQLMVAAALQHLRAEIGFVDMKAEDPKRLKKYGQVPYGNETLEKLTVGASFESVREAIERSALIGITANFTYESVVVQEFMRYVKRVNPHAKIVVGGSDATARPGRYLDNEADCVMIGKAEITGPQAIQALLTEQSLEKIPAVAYKGELGKIIINPRNRKNRTDARALPLPALELASAYQWTQAAEGGLPEGVSERVGVLETSRGCDEACSFCATTFQIGLYKDMPLDQIRENLDHLQSTGIETVIFIDDNILYRTKEGYGGTEGRKELITLFEEMRERGLSWTFYNGIQFCLLEQSGKVDEELIDAMFQNNNRARCVGESYVGAFRAYIPLERLTDESRRKFEKLKPFDVQDRIIKAISQRTPAMLNMGFIVGYADETPDDLQRMEQRGGKIRELVERESQGKTHTKFMPFCLIPIPGTPDYLRAVKEGRFAYDIAEHPELTNGYASILRSDHLTPQEITRWRADLEAKLNAM